MTDFLAKGYILPSAFHDILDEYETISGKTGAEICMFSGGGHPAILSNAEQAAEVIRKFLSRADAKND